MCNRCGHRHEPHTPHTPTCTICVRYSTVTHNAARTRRNGNQPGCEMTRTDFATWFDQQPRSCHYCGINEDDLPHLGLHTQMGLPLQRLGIDRIDNHHPYDVDNIVLCCFACNKARSNTFASSEMVVIGGAIAAVWQQRLNRHIPHRTDPTHPKRNDLPHR